MAGIFNTTLASRNSILCSVIIYRSLMRLHSRLVVNNNFCWNCHEPRHHKAAGRLLRARVRNFGTKFPKFPSFQKGEKSIQPKKFIQI